MGDMTVIDRGNHCEIHQGDAIAADYVASKRLATMFAAAPELLLASKCALADLMGMSVFVDEDHPCFETIKELQVAIDIAEGRE